MRSTAEVLSTKYLPAENAFVAEAYVNDVGPLRLIIDTGSTITLLDNNLRGRLGDPTKAREVVGNNASAQRISFELMTLDQVRLGGWHARSTSAVFYDLSNLKAAMDEPVDGIAGMTLFTNGLLTLDFQKREVRAELLGVAQKPKGTAIPFRWHKGIPVVEAMVASRRLDARIDSAFDGAFEFPRAVAPMSA